MRRWLGVLRGWVSLVFSVALLLPILFFVLGILGLYVILYNFGVNFDIDDAMRLWMPLVAIFATASLPLLIYAEFQAIRRERQMQADEEERAESHRRREEEAERLERARQAATRTFRRTAELLNRETYGVEMTDAEKALLDRISSKSPGEREAAWADWQKVKGFYAERLSIERFVVGDEQAGIRSPYQVEMTTAEAALLSTISPRFDPSCLLVDTYLDRGDGRTTQIDIIAICRQGIIVIESKGLGGTVRGRADDAEWMLEASGQRIYNPIRQNNLHVESIYRVFDPTETQLQKAAEAEEFGSLNDALYRCAHEQLEGRSLLFADRKDSDKPMLLVFDDGVRPDFFRIEIPGRERFLDFRSEHAVAYGLVAFGDDDRPPDFQFLPEWIYSLVVFNEGATFPDLRLHSSTRQVAAAHRVTEAIDRILSRDEVLSHAEVMKMAYKIREHRVVPDRDVREAHIRNIQVSTGRYGVLE